MESDSVWAVTAGRTGVHFTPAPGNSGFTPPEVSLKAILPDGSEVLPITESPHDPTDHCGFGFVFDPVMPDGAVVHINDRAVLTVGPGTG